MERSVRAACHVRLADDSSEKEKKQEKNQFSFLRD